MLFCLLNEFWRVVCCFFFVLQRSRLCMLPFLLGWPNSADEWFSLQARQQLGMCCLLGVLLKLGKRGWKIRIVVVFYFIFFPLSKILLKQDCFFYSLVNESWCVSSDRYCFSRWMGAGAEQLESSWFIQMCTWLCVLCLYLLFTFRT